MTAKLYLLCVLIVESISGALCYDYDVGGMVAASLAAFIFLIIIVIMVIVTVLWRDWYMRRQARKGRYRIPREKWRLFKYNAVKRADSYVETPRSDRRVNMRMYNVAHMPGSKATTLERQEPITDAWVTRLPPANYYEEKSKTMKLEAEEDNVIVAEVLPEANLHTTKQSVQPVIITSSQPSTRQTVKYQDPSNTTFVSYNADTTPSTTQATHMQQTATPQHVSYKPYHVQVKMAQADEPAQYFSQTTRPIQQTTRPANQLSKTMPTGTGRSDIFIQPIVPASDPLDNQATGVVVFDSDDEAGNIPTTRQTEDVVLF